jgi:alkaline phosphatase
MRRFFLFLLILFTISCGSGPADRPQNVIFFISDGCGPASFSLARDYQRGVAGAPSLQIDAFESGSTITHPLEIRVTDSAASATAYACAAKTVNYRIGMTPDGQPMETILEKAEAAGFQTALVSTASITHATPAAFSSHVDHRDKEAEIGEQQITKGIEILMGGGRQFYLPTEAGGLRQDGRDLLAELEGMGYHRADDRDALMAADSLPLVALFTSSHMAFEMDRDPSKEPSLAEMTTRALELLGKSDKPFFIMIEAGRIDHAGHNNDPAAHLHDVLAYDAAWQAAIDFARLEGNTLVVGTSDHETGGLTLGGEINGILNSGYAYDPTRLEPLDISVEAFMNDLRRDHSAGTLDREAFAARIAAAFPIDVQKAAGDLDRLYATDAVALTAFNGPMNTFLTRAISDSARVGWSTSGHTAVNVPIFSWGPGSEAFRGAMDNTEVGRTLQEMLGLE